MASHSFFVMSLTLAVLLLLEVVRVVVCVGFLFIRKPLLVRPSLLPSSTRFPPFEMRVIVTSGSSSLVVVVWIGVEVELALMVPSTSPASLAPRPTN